MPVRHPLHVVQISRDRALLARDMGGEAMRRQLEYARELRRRVPGSTVTIIVVGRPTASTGTWRHENLGVVCASGPMGGALQCARILRRVHRVTPISLITTQVPYDEAWMALLVGRWHRIPVAAQIQSDLFAGDPSAQRARRVVLAVRRWIARRTLGAFAAVWAVSSEARASVARFARNTVLATIPVPAAMLTRTRMASPLRAKQALVVYAGPLAPDYDLMTWLQVAARVARRCPSARFEIFGDGPERPGLEREADRLGLGDVLRFAALPSADRLAQVYADAAVLLLTSRTARADRLEQAVVEAASQGTAAVSTSPGSRDLIVHGVTGFLHEADDVDEVARSVRKLLDDAGRAASMGDRARTLVTAKFDPQRVRAAWVDLWVRAATGRVA